MHYYLDGYNCLFCTEGIHNNLNQQRTRFLEHLRACVLALNLDATVVFDSTIQSAPTRGHLHPLECIYTSRYETADQYLLALIEHHRSPSRITLVTSDNQLATFARHHGAHTIEVFPFFNWLQKRYAKVKHQELHITKTPEKLLSEHKKSAQTPLSTLPALPTPVKPVATQKEDLCALFEERYRAACAEEATQVQVRAREGEGVQVQRQSPESAKKEPNPKQRQSLPAKCKKTGQKPSSAPPLNPLESETQRWRRLFEQNLQQNSD